LVIVPLLEKSRIGDLMHVDQQKWQRGSAR
jgi:hypothetical protein